MSGRRRKGGHGGEFHVDERWMTSYADMITVLMCLFIVLYAMSTVNSHKFDVLKNSLASGFGVTKSHELTLSQGVPIPKDLVDKNGAGFSKSLSRTAVDTKASTSAANEPDTKDLAEKIESALKRAGVASKAEVQVQSKGITIGLVGSSTYFGPNDATLQPEGYRVLNAVGPVLRGVDHTVTVEGHADPHGTAGAFGSDWALASARATTVLVYLVDNRDVAAKRISAISYGSAHPVTTGTTDEQRNRRVDIVVHTPAAATPTSPATPAAKAAATPGPTSSPSATKADAASK